MRALNVLKMKTTELLNHWSEEDNHKDWQNGWVYVRCNKKGKYKDILTALVYSADELVSRSNVIVHHESS